MMILLYIIASLIFIYLLLTLFCFYFFHQLPRNPVKDEPDWGKVLDTKISALDGGFLEVWRVNPEGSSKGIILFAHGWGRNRDRMMGRARIFGKWGFTTVIHSARDHGGSSPKKFMNALKFARDIEAVLNWIDKPVILYGHSAGAAGAIIAASRNPDKIKLLLLEGCYAYTKEALLNLYAWLNRPFGILFGPMIIFWMDLFYKNVLDKISPAHLAPALRMPVMIIHGEKDGRFPVRLALTLKNSFSPGQAELYIAPGAGHSDASLTPGYKPAVKAFLGCHLLSPSGIGFNKGNHK